MGNFYLLFVQIYSSYGSFKRNARSLKFPSDNINMLDMLKLDEEMGLELLLFGKANVGLTA